MKSFCGVLIAVLLLSSYVFAQSPSVRFSENYQDAAYIFKGKVVKVEAKRGKDKRVYAAYLIDIEHIYKGVDQLKIGKVELITLAPRNWSLQEDGSILEMAINWGTYGQGTEPEHDVELEFDSKMKERGLEVPEKKMN